jgi:hypothetical protein
VRFLARIVGAFGEACTRPCGDLRLNRPRHTRIEAGCAHFIICRTADEKRFTATACTSLTSFRLEFPTAEVATESAAARAPGPYLVTAGPNWHEPHAHDRGDRPPNTQRTADLFDRI